MSQKTGKTDRYWDQFLRSLPRGADRPEDYQGSFSFGFTPDDASEIAELVVEAIKTATGSLLWSFEHDNAPIPKAGDHWIVVDGNDDPVCIIRTTDVSIIPFDEVSEDYARDGGEGDGSLNSWRRLYWNYLLAECRRINREPLDNTPMVMERFSVVYRAPMQAA